MRMAFVALALLAFSTCARAADVPATAADVAAKWKALAPGDRLVLSGSFPQVVVLADKAFSPAATVDASAATFAAVIVQRTSNLRWTGGTFRPTSAIGRPGLQVSSTQGVSFAGLHYVGDGTLNGVNVVNSADVELVGSSFERPRVAINLSNVQRGHIAGNAIWGWNGDGIGLGATTDTLIEKNVLSNPLLIDLGLHPDGIQGYFTGAVANQRITVRGNVVHGVGTQGVFFNAYPGYANPQAITIEGNTVETADAPNGILLQGDPAGAVRNNHTSTLPGSKWRTDVKIMDPVTAHCGNVTEAYSVWAAVNDPAACPAP